MGIERSGEVRRKREKERSEKEGYKGRWRRKSGKSEKKKKIEKEGGREREGIMRTE